MSIYKVENPLVSVIIASLNREKFIGNAIDSVLNQTYPNVEIIVVDGDSSDRTIEVLKSYSDKIKWISEPDKGEPDAYNKALKMVSGDIVNFLPSDDILELNAAEIAVEAFLYAQSDVAMINGDGLFINNLRKVIGFKKSVQFSYRGLVKVYPDKLIMPSAFILKNAVENIGRWDVNIWYASDLDLWIRLHKKYRSQYVPVPLSSHRVHDGSLTICEFPKAVYDSFRVRRKYGGTFSIATIKELRFLLRYFVLKYFLPPDTSRHYLLKKAYHFAKGIGNNSV